MPQDQQSAANQVGDAGVFVARDPGNQAQRAEDRERADGQVEQEDPAPGCLDEQADDDWAESPRDGAADGPDLDVLAHLARGAVARTRPRLDGVRMAAPAA